jgi:hypothetical protein
MVSGDLLSDLADDLIQLKAYLYDKEEVSLRGRHCSRPKNAK